MKKKTVAVIFGGNSSEHEVSRRSAQTIIGNIPRDKYDVVMVGINKKGEWRIFDGPIELIGNGKWESEEHTRVAMITPDPSIGGLIILAKGGMHIIKIDVVIPVLHGKNGEDGTIQGLLTLSKIPYVGCNTLSSAMCMDKISTNIMLSYMNIEQAKFTWIIDKEFERDIQSSLNRIEQQMGSYPVFVKPSNAGSSVGVSKAGNRKELLQALLIAFKEDSRVLIEEAIVGKEVECAVFGDKKLKVSRVGEIATADTDEFYDYDSKYKNNTTDLYIPARIDDKTAEKIRQTAKEAFTLMGCSGLSRIDFFVEKNTGRVLLNEINTFPGFTSISMYPMLMDDSNMPIADLIDGLILTALEREGKLDE